jgi:glycine/D-amino acid oxidase-like deaminating enzyme
MPHPPSRATSPDVIIVGAGLIGCACAYALARRRLSVTVLERGDLAEGASGACDGHVCCQSKAPGVHLDLARRSLALHEHLSEELGEATGFRRCGSWLIAETEAEWQALEHAAEERRVAGLPIELHAGDDLHRAEPVLSASLRGGSFCAVDGQTDPWRTTLALAHAAQRLGAEARLGLEVSALRLRRGRVTGVETRGGPIDAGSVLLCVGAWTAQLLRPLGVDVGLRPRRGEILVTEPMPPLLSSIILHSPYVTSKLDHGADGPAMLVLEQTTDGNVLVGSTRAFAGLDSRNTPEGIGSVAGEAARLAPAIGDLHLIRTFAGLRPCSEDGLPLVGPVAGVEGLFVATGHEGDGVALAPITGQIVADAISASAGWVAELLPARVSPRRAGVSPQ